MKTDLAKTLSIRGQHGLFNYIAQSRTGAIAESLEDKKRYNFSANAGITTLADISIYTAEGEIKLQEVFGKMHEVLGDKLAPTAKSADSELKALFSNNFFGGYAKVAFYIPDNIATKDDVTAAKQAILEALSHISPTDPNSLALAQFFGVTLLEGYEFMQDTEVCGELEDIMQLVDPDLTAEQAAAITAQTLNPSES